MENKILVETSARHIHLTQEAVEALFGAGHVLTKKKDLSQPGQFACEEKVTVVNKCVDRKTGAEVEKTLTMSVVSGGVMLLIFAHGFADINLSDMAFSNIDLIVERSFILCQSPFTSALIIAFISVEVMSFNFLSPMCGFMYRFMSC